MQGVSSKRLMIALLLCGLSGIAMAQSQPEQSLGEAARANRVQQQAQETSGTAPKVITNQDLPPGSTPVPQSSNSDSMTMVSGIKRSNPHADQPMSDRLVAPQHSGTQWKTRIQDQETRIAEQQARIDRVNAMARASAGTGSYSTPTNRYRAMQMQRLALMQERLDQQKQRLEMMQDAARRSGMGQ